MTPILGIMASAISGNLVTNSYESISTVTLGSTTSTISFTSIPSTYKHLQIRGILRKSAAAGGDACYLQFNSDTGANYSFHRLYGDGSSATAYGEASTTYACQFIQASSSHSASVFGVNVIDVLDYQNTNKYKTVRILAGYDNNGSGVSAFYSGNWRNTNAISTITINAGVDSLAQYSSLALYGIKG